MAKKRGGSFTLQETEVFFEIFETCIENKPFDVNTLGVQQITLLYVLRARLVVSGTDTQAAVITMKSRIDLLIQKLFERITDSVIMLSFWQHLQKTLASDTTAKDKINIHFFQHIRAQTAASRLTSDETEALLKHLRQKTTAPPLLRSITMMRKLLHEPHKFIHKILRRESRRRVSNGKKTLTSPRPRGKTL